MAERDTFLSSLFLQPLTEAKSGDLYTSALGPASLVPTAQEMAAATKPSAVAAPASLQSLIFQKEELTPAPMQGVTPPGAQTPEAPLPPFPSWEEVRKTREWEQGSTETKQQIERAWLKTAREWGNTTFTDKKDREAYQRALAGATVTKMPVATVGDRLSDVVNQLMVGTANIGSMVGTLGNVISQAAGGGTPFSGDTANRGFFYEMFNPDLAQERAKAYREDYSKALKDRERRSQELIEATKQAGGGELAQFGTALGAGLSNPSLIAKLAVENAPSLVIGAGGGLVARGLAGGTTAAARGLAFTRGAGTAEAALNAGDAAQNVVDRLTSATEEQWRTDPEYRALLENGVDAAQAKQQLAYERAQMAAVIGAATGYFAGKVGLEEVLGGAAGAGMRRRLGRVAGEAGTEVAEEVVPQVAANVEMQRLAPQTGTFEDTGVTAAQALLGAGPTAVLAGLANAPEQAPDATPPAAPPAPPAPPAPTGPETFRDRAAARIAPLEQTLADIQSNPNLSENDRIEQATAVEELLSGWRAAADEYENTAPVVRLRKDIDQASARIEQIANSTVDDATKAALLAPLQAKVQRSAELLALNDLDEAQLEQYVTDRDQALLDMESERGTGARGTPEMRTRLVEERNLANQILDQRALIETPTERAFAARERTAFEKDPSGNYIYPTRESLRQMPLADAFNAIADIAQSRIYDARTNRIYTRSERQQFIGDARQIESSILRARDTLVAPMETIQQLGADLRQGLTNTVRQGNDVGSGRLNELAAVIVREAEAAGETGITWGDAIDRASQELLELLQRNAPPPTAPPGPPPPPTGPSTGPTAPAPPGVGKLDLEGYTFNTGTVSTGGGRNFKNQAEAKEALAVLRSVTDTPGGLPKALIQALGLRFLKCTTGQFSGWYMPSSHPWGAGQTAIAIGSNMVGKLKHVTAHEIGHAIDDILRNRNWISMEFPHFQRGGILRREAEAWDAKYLKSPGLSPDTINENGLNYWYPLRTSMLAGDYDAQTLELFCQALGFYHSNPKDLEKYMPMTYAFAKDLCDGLNRISSAGQLADTDIAGAVREAFSRVGNATGNRPVQPAAGGVGTQRSNAAEAGAVPGGGPAGGGVAAAVRPEQAAAGPRVLIQEAADAIVAETGTGPEAAAAIQAAIDEITVVPAGPAEAPAAIPVAGAEPGAGAGTAETAAPVAEPAAGPAAAQAEPGRAGPVEAATAAGEFSASEVIDITDRLRRLKADRMIRADLRRGAEQGRAAAQDLANRVQAVRDALPIGLRLRDKATGEILRVNAINGIGQVNLVRQDGTDTNIFPEVIVDRFDVLTGPREISTTAKPKGVAAYGYKTSSASKVANALSAMFGIPVRQIATALPQVEIIPLSAFKWTGTGDSATGSATLNDGSLIQGVTPTVGAFYAPDSNRVVIIADNIFDGSERSVIYHELFHKRGGQILGRDVIDKFRETVLSWKPPAGATDLTPEQQLYVRAMPRVRAAIAGKKGKALTTTAAEELLPYFIEEAVNMGFRLDVRTPISRGPIGRFMREWIGAVKNAMRRAFGRSLPDPTIEDLLAAAYGAAQLELPGVGTERAMRVLQGRDGWLNDRLRQIRREGFDYNPDVAPKGERARGVRPSEINPIYATQQEAARANRQAPPPGPGQNANNSIYQRFQPVKASPMKTRSTVRQWAQTGENPTAPWFPQAQDEFIENWVDHQRPVWNWLREMGLSNAPWQKLKLIPGRLRALTDRYTREIVDPLSNDIAAFAKKNGISATEAVQAAGQWATMRHIPEANAQLRKKIMDRIARGELQAIQDLRRFDETQRGMHPNDNDQERGAMAGGWSDEEARAIQAQIEAKYGEPDLRRLGDKIVDGFAAMRNEALKSGQLSKQALSLFPKFKHYVALTGTPWDDSANDAFGSYVAPNVLKERGGRIEGVADNAMVALVDRIGRVASYAASVEFKQSINELYEQEGGEKNTVGIVKLNSEAAQSPWDSDIIWQDPKDGKRYIFRFTGPAEAVGPALLNKNREYADSAVGRMLDRATRLFSRAVTQWTLAFAPVNMIRDIQEKSVLVRSRGLFDAAGNRLDVNKLFSRTWANAIKPETWKAAAALARGGEADDTTAAGRLANELVTNGGVSTFGATLRRGQDSIANAVQRRMGARKRIKQLDDAVVAYNTLFELISSISTHAAMRELGVESKQAAFQTLDLMNFGNQGAKTAWLRHLYSFFNPAVQSGVNLWRQLANNPQGQRDALAMFFVMSSLYALAYALSPEDDEGIGKKIDERGAFEIERNFPLYLGGDTPVKIPVGFGLPQLMWATMVNASRFMSGRYDAKSALAQQATSFIKTFSPVPPSEVEFTRMPNVFLAKTFTPTVFRPVVDLATDTNAWGSKLTAYYPDKTRYASEQGAVTTPVLYKRIAEDMRQTAGIDAFPEQWRTFIEGTPMAWGPFGYLLKSMTQSTAEMEGRQKDPIDELPFSTALRVVGASRFIGGTSRYLEAKYHAEYETALRDVREYNLQDRRGNGEQWLAANPERAQRIQAIKANEKTMRSITKDYNALLRGMQDGTIDVGEGQSQLEQIADDRRNQMRDFLKLTDEWDEEELAEPEGQ